MSQPNWIAPSGWTQRRYTEAEQAQNHCQVGNMGLAIKVILDWLDAAGPPTWCRFGIAIRVIEDHSNSPRPYNARYTSIIARFFENARGGPREVLRVWLWLGDRDGQSLGPVRSHPGTARSSDQR
jgi:hypothetical protein